MLSVLAACLVLPGIALAQSFGAIAGAVTDTTGAVLPGVTVEASSPALIEKVRTAVTDGQGRYSIENLRPGTYAVTFALVGFNGLLREGVELRVGFTAPVNAQMQVGAVEETVTVTGASPTVDVRNVRTQMTLDVAKTLSVLPNSQSLNALTAMALGAVVTGNATGGIDVGGGGGETGTVSFRNNRGNDFKMSQEGMDTMSTFGSNGGNVHFGQEFNMEGVAEMTLSSNGMSADTETAGVQINYIPKDGGNVFRGSGRATFTNGKFQSNNLTAALKSRGASTPSSIKAIYDYGGGMGGKIKRDRLWFYTAHRWWGSEQYAPASFSNKVQGQKAPNGRPLYEPDLSKRGFSSDLARENSGRLMWQATRKDKLTYFGNSVYDGTLRRGLTSITTPESTYSTVTGPGQHLSQATWARPHSNRVLVEAGFTWLNNQFLFIRQPGVGKNDVSILEQSTGFIYNAVPTAALAYVDVPSQTGQKNGRGSLSYVTGSHSFKGGFSVAHGILESQGSINSLQGFGPVNIRLLNTVPVAVELYNHPFYLRNDYRNMAFYAQDQWTIKHATINLGVRSDFFDGWTPAADVPDTEYLSGFRVDRLDKTPRWRDVSPRLGFAYDLSGDSKTAIKASVGRYVAGAGGGFPQSMNPAGTVSTQTLRTWTDSNNNFFPDGDPKNPAANGELGPSQNAAFGSRVVTRFFDNDMVLKNRQYTWQMSAAFERELRSNMRVAVTYFRTAHFDQTVNDNLSVTGADYDPYCVTVPSDPRLPGGGGNQQCGFSDVSFAGLRRAPKTLTRNEGTFGDRTEVYNGVEIGLNARFTNGATVQGGMATGRTVDDNCYVVDSPQQLYQCRVVAGAKQNLQVKVNGSYPLPGGFIISAIFQNIVGPEIRALAVFSNAGIAPSLGRNLASCATPTGTCNANVALDVFPQRNSAFESRVSMLDFRAMKEINLGFGRVRASLDLYNALNASPILARNNSFGATWGTPTQILPGRLVKLGAQFNF